MVRRANALAARPEFYNTLTNSCTSNLVAHVNAIAPGRIPAGWRTLLPGYADEVALELGLIQGSASIDDARRRFRVNDRALRYADDSGVLVPHPQRGAGVGSMTALRFHTLDVFTERRFGGNPLAVVFGADGLPDATLQVIAREFNLSETVFMLPPTDRGATHRVRIFTPSRELPFAGHPTIGTAILLAQLGEGRPVRVARASCCRRELGWCRLWSVQVPADRSSPS